MKIVKVAGETLKVGDVLINGESRSGHTISAFDNYSPPTSGFYLTYPLGARWARTESGAVFIDNNDHYLIQL